MKQYTITVNGNVYHVTVEENDGAPVVTEAVKQTPAPAAKAAPVQAPAAGGVKIECPMSGKILRISASKGQAVKKGDVLMVLEAMKMENDIVAPADGVVASINVNEGQSVESGNLLATLH